MADLLFNIEDILNQRRLRPNVVFMSNQQLKAMAALNMSDKTKGLIHPMLLAQPRTIDLNADQKLLDLLPDDSICEIYESIETYDDKGQPGSSKRVSLKRIMQLEVIASARVNHQCVAICRSPDKRLACVEILYGMPSEIRYHVFDTTELTVFADSMPSSLTANIVNEFEEIMFNMFMFDL